MTISGTVLNQLGLNGGVFSHQPTDHHWLDRDSIGTDGNGMLVYVAPRQYEMKFDFLDTDEWNTMYSYFITQGVTGTVTATLPQWDTTPYTFKNYSGCVMRELTYEGWFQNYYQNVRLLLVRINNT